MSLLNWFSSRKKPEALHSEMASSGLSRLESTKPVHVGQMRAAAQPANRKQERLARRELLYGVVREAMVRAGVLSSSYKFKVLSLDPRGQQFLVMVDLAHGAGGETTRLAEIEAMVAQTAKSRHEILVSAVYWRSIDHVAVGDPTRAKPYVSRPAPLQAETPAPSRPQALRPEPVPHFEAELSSPAQLHEAPSQPTPLPSRPAAANSRPGPLSSRPAELPPVAPVKGGPFEPLHPDEVAAFKEALATGISGAQAMAAANGGKPGHAGQQSYTLLTGFEDTELTDGDEDQNLSGTQYGALR
jgi:hypothetical protein